MGLSGISFGSLLIILAVVFIIFGSKRLSRIGQDLGDAVKNFRKGMQDSANQTQHSEQEKNPDSATLKKNESRTNE
jgi:sec-independent protein translocase protein TatA